MLQDQCHRRRLLVKSAPVTCPGPSTIEGGWVEYPIAAGGSAQSRVWNGKSPCNVPRSGPAARRLDTVVTVRVQQQLNPAIRPVARRPLGLSHSCPLRAVRRRRRGTSLTGRRRSHKVRGLDGWRRRTVRTRSRRRYVRTDVLRTVRGCDARTTRLGYPCLRFPLDERSVLHRLHRLHRLHSLALAIDRALLASAYIVSVVLSASLLGSVCAHSLVSYRRSRAPCSDVN